MNRRPGLIVARLMCCLAVALYSTSFFLPTFATVIDGKVDVSPGYAAFIVGMGSLFNTLLGGYRLFLPWLANPIFALAVYRFFRGRFRASAIMGARAVVASGLLFLFDEWPIRWDFYFGGLYFWLLSMVVLSVAAGIAWAVSGSDGVVSSRQDLLDFGVAAWASLLVAFGLYWMSTGSDDLLNYFGSGALWYALLMSWMAVLSGIWLSLKRGTLDGCLAAGVATPVALYSAYVLLCYAFAVPAPLVVGR